MLSADEICVQNICDCGDKEPPVQPDYYGRGLKGNRYCTDLICILLFLIGFIVWIVLSCIVLSANSRIDYFLVKRDKSGHACGIDTDVMKRPYYLYEQFRFCRDLFAPSRGDKQNCTPECRFNCPKVAWQKIRDPKQRVMNCYTEPNMTHCHRYFLRPYRLHKTCVYNIRDLKFFKIMSEQLYLKNITNPPTYYRTRQYLWLWLTVVLQNVLSIFTLKDTIHEGAQDILQDILAHGYRIFLAMLVVAAVLTIIFIVALRKLAKVMVILSILATIALFICSAEANPKKKSLYLAILIVSSICLAVILPLIVFLRNRIRLAIIVIQQASKAVAATPSLLCILPIILILIYIGIIVLTVLTAIYLTIWGNPIYKIMSVPKGCNRFKDNEGCETYDFLKIWKGLDKNLQKTCKGAACRYIQMNHTASYSYYHVYNMMGFIWTWFFFHAWAELLVVMVAVNWYWTFDKAPTKILGLSTAILRTLRYHMGTVVFGALFISIFRVIRYTLEYLFRYPQTFKKPFPRMIGRCWQWWAWVFEYIFRYLDKNAYVMVALHGTNLCESGKDALILITRNFLRVMVLEKVTGFLFILTAILIGLLTGGIAYAIYTINIYTMPFEDLNKLVSAQVGPLALTVAVFAFFVSTIFFNIFALVVNTILICFFEDCERFDGTPEKPYYMCNELSTFLGKYDKLFTPKKRFRKLRNLYKIEEKVVN